ncbi:MAG: SDR family oxidoreductase [Proteobacteria bacterium]|nr:SDR family oxidoreductase [Pseudomonadota bacterium]
MAGRLENKVVLITGTGGGQGKAAAILFAKEGAKVVGCDLKVEDNKETVRIIREAGGEMVSLEPIDLTNAEHAKRLVALTEKTYGRLDVLYNNASAARFAPMMEMSFEDWDFTIKNELNLIFVITKAALPLMVKSKGSSVINTASIAGMVAAHGNSVSHAATKGGVIAFSRQLSIEVASHGIRVNTISPGVIRTPGTEHIFSDQNLVDMMVKQIPMGRYGLPEDIAKVALFLASDDSGFMTGTTIVVDGGQTA